MKRDKLDILFSKLVRERSGWTCDNCHKYFPEEDRQALHCSHFWTRSRRATRWHPNSAASHCVFCHKVFTEDPALFGAWIVTHLGQERSEEMRKLSLSYGHLTKGDKADIYKHLQGEYQKIMDQREQGVTGRIDFDPAPILVELEGKT